jgi:hypothetical protein
VVEEVDLPLAGARVHPEAELVVMDHHRRRPRDRAREDLVAGIHERARREVEHRGDVVEDEPLQVATQDDDLRALLDLSRGGRLLCVDDGGAEVVLAAARDGDGRDGVRAQL